MNSVNSFFGVIFYTALALGLLAGAWGWLLVLFKQGPRALLGEDKVILGEFQTAVVFKEGQFERILPQGVHWIRAKHRSLVILDMRPEVFRIEQTIVTSDSFSAGMLYIARVQISEPRAVVKVSQNPKEEIAARLQLVMKQVAETQTIRELCIHHDKLNAAAQERAARAIADAGYTCVGFEVLQVDPRGAIAELETKKKVGFTSA